jgi:hypothetical protein
MGLELLDVVLEVEKQFGISLHDRDVSNCRTIGDLYRAVLAKVGKWKGDISPFQQGFGLLRGYLTEQFQIPQEKICPETKFITLFSPFQRRSVCKRMAGDLKIRLLPLQRPRWVKGIIALLWAAVTGYMVFNFPDYLLTLTLNIPCSAVWLFLLLWMTVPLMIKPPKGLQTIDQIVRFMVPNPEDIQGTETDIWEKFRTICSERLGISKEKIVPEMDLCTI